MFVRILQSEVAHGHLMFLPPIGDISYRILIMIERWYLPFVLFFIVL